MLSWWPAAQALHWWHELHRRPGMVRIGSTACSKSTNRNNSEAATIRVGIAKKDSESAEASGRRCLGCQNRHPPPHPKPFFGPLFLASNGYLSGKSGPQADGSPGPPLPAGPPPPHPPPPSPPPCRRVALNLKGPGSTLRSRTLNPKKPSTPKREP